MSDDIAVDIEKKIVLEVNFPLRVPIDDGGQIITSVTLRRPKLLDNLRSSKTKGTDDDKEVYFISLLTGLTPDLLSQIDLADFFDLKKEYQSFLD